MASKTWTPRQPAQQQPDEQTVTLAQALTLECQRLANKLGEMGVRVNYGEVDSGQLTAIVEVRALAQLLLPAANVSPDTWLAARLAVLRELLATFLQQQEEKAKKGPDLILPEGARVPPGLKVQD